MVGRRHGADGVPGRDREVHAWAAPSRASGAVPADYLITLDALADAGIKPLDSLLFITTDESADQTAVRSQIDDIIADLPTVTLKDPAGFAAEQKEQIDLFL